MTPLRVPLHMSLSQLDQAYPPGTWTPGMTPGETPVSNKLYTAIKLVYPPDHKTRAGKLASQDIRFHARVEDSATAADVGGTTSVKTVDVRGLIYPETSSTATTATKYVSITPLDQIPDGPKINEAMIWRYPVEFSTAPKVTEIWLEPGGGVQPTFPGAPKRVIPEPIPTPTPPGPPKETDWTLIIGIGIVALGAGFLIYQLAAGGKRRAGPLPAPEEA